jgi:hypothetical protein
VIYQKNDNYPLEFIDDDENSLEIFCKEIESAFSAQTVTTLHFKNNSILLRPHLLSKIYVEDIIQQDMKPFQKQEILKPSSKPKEKIETTEDMITEE